MKIKLSKDKIVPADIVKRRKQQREQKARIKLDPTGIPATRKVEGYVRGRRDGTPYTIDWKKADKLFMIQCTCAEVAAFLEISIDTLRRRCQQDHSMTIVAYRDIKKNGGRASLRRMQWSLAEKNAAMSMFLGKQYLGQADKIDTTNMHKHVNTDLSKIKVSDLGALETLLSQAEVSSNSNSNSGEED